MEVLIYLDTHVAVWLYIPRVDAPSDTAQRQSWTRDPFGRLIVGSAACKKMRLVTKDQTIQEHFDFAVW